MPLDKLKQENISLLSAQGYTYGIDSMIYFEKLRQNQGMGKDSNSFNCFEIK